MKDEKYLMNHMEKISQNNIEKLRKSCKENKKIENYLFKESEKIFKKLVFPYFRFEILLKCLTDINNNYKEHYPEVEIKKVNIIINKLEEICTYLNIALDEYYTMLSYIEQNN